MSPQSTDPVDLRDEYPSSFEDVEELVGLIGTDAIRLILDQIEREALDD